MSENRDRLCGRESDRAARRRRRDGAVVVLWRWRASRQVSALYIGGRQTPLVRTVVRVAARIVDAVCPLSQGGSTRVLEVVDPLPAHVRIRDPTEVDPQVAVLVPEQRGKG